MSNGREIQRVIKIGSWGLAGIIAVGAVLDALSNAIAIVTRAVSIFGSLGLVAIWCIAQVWLRLRPLSWRAIGGSDIKLRSLGAGTTAAFLGAIALLWFPRIVELYKPPLSSHSDPISTVAVEPARNPPSRKNLSDRFASDFLGGRKLSFETSEDITWTSPDQKRTVTVEVTEIVYFDLVSRSRFVTAYIYTVIASDCAVLPLRPRPGSCDVGICGQALRSEV